MFGSKLAVDATAKAALVASTRAAARAEFDQWSQMLELADELWDRVNEQDEYFRRMVEHSAIPLTIGQLVGLSEGQVSSRLAVASRVRARAPQTWKAFRKGRVDGARVREISRAIDRLRLAKSHERLDTIGLGYAETHTVTELRGWLKRFVARAEPEQFNVRADEERRKRYVKIVHGDDGMSWIDAYVPSHHAAAIESRLEAGAVAQKLGADPDDDRTKDQRRADLLSQWLLAENHAPANLTIDVGVTLPVTALSGGTGDPTMSADGQWGIPTSWALDEFMRSNTFWHRIVIDPVTDDVLAHDYVGRFAPELLSRALLFKYAVCQAPGCCKPAGRCDIDHRSPWPEGRTSGDNLWPLCRRHHSFKGHQILQWLLPTGQIVPAETADFTLAA